MRSDRVTGAERTWLLRHLRTVHEAMDDVVRHMTPAEWVCAGTLGNWSPSEIVEHTLLVDAEILGAVSRHLKDDPSPDWERLTGNKEAALKRYLPNMGRAQANAETSTFRGCRQEDVKDLLDRNYRVISGLLEKHSDTPLKAIVWHHSGMGALSAYLWLLYIPLHAERHLNQLLRIAE